MLNPYHILVLQFSWLVKIAKKKIDNRVVLLKNFIQAENSNEEKKC